MIIMLLLHNFHCASLQWEREPEPVRANMFRINFWKGHFWPAFSGIKIVGGTKHWWQDLSELHPSLIAQYQMENNFRETQERLMTLLYRFSYYNSRCIKWVEGLWILLSVQHGSQYPAYGAKATRSESLEMLHWFCLSNLPKDNNGGIDKTQTRMWWGDSMRADSGRDKNKDGKKCSQWKWQKKEETGNK